MKKWGIIIAFIIIFIVAIFVGNYIYDSNNEDKNTVKSENTSNSIVNQVDYSVRNDITINTDSEEEKISPNATLILKKHYKECDHTIKEYAEIPEEFVNLTKSEIEKEYPEWEVEKFTPLDIILIKEEEGFCNEHFILKEEQGVITVYKIDKQGEESLYDTTGISVEYLTESDKLELKNGIKVYGKEELNSMLENYE